jgi:hypothetical protein
MKKSMEEFVAACENLWRDFNNCRAHFPYVPPETKGAKMVRTAPYYIAQGFDIEFTFSEGISEEGIKKINQIGHWLNQNFVIRLCAVLESFQIISSSGTSNQIDFNIEEAKHVNLVRRLRHCFAHSSGRYDPTNAEHRKTMGFINQTLGVPTDGLTVWPISIDTVLRPLYEGCMRYAKQRSI